MRAAVVEYHKGKEELSSMDDELPVCIYVMLVCQTPNIFAEISLVEDFVDLDPYIENE